MFGVKLSQFFFIDVLLALVLIKQANFLICNSSGKFQNDLDGQDLMLASVHFCAIKLSTILMTNFHNILVV
jgi:hypothetical protein